MALPHIRKVSSTCRTSHDEQVKPEAISVEPCSAVSDVSGSPLKPWDFYFSPEEAEAVESYQPGGYHPVHLGDRYNGQGLYKILHKLGFGSYATVWLAKDLAATK